MTSFLVEQLLLENHPWSSDRLMTPNLEASGHIPHPHMIQTPLRSNPRPHFINPRAVKKQMFVILSALLPNGTNIALRLNNCQELVFISNYNIVPKQHHPEHLTFKGSGISHKSFQLPDTSPSPKIALLKDLQLNLPVITGTRTTQSLVPSTRVNSSIIHLNASQTFTFQSKTCLLKLISHFHLPLPFLKMHHRIIHSLFMISS